MTKKRNKTIAHIIKIKTLKIYYQDARSQASGGSAASGASAVSSEPDQETEDTGSSSDRKASSGLRNTLDIGQHQHNMENPQQQRNVRSMSAPPENRNNMQDNNQQKFVSRVDINPQVCSMGLRIIAFT